MRTPHRSLGSVGRSACMCRRAMRKAGMDEGLGTQRLNDDVVGVERLRPG